MAMRLTQHTLLVLRTLMNEPVELSGSDICELVNKMPGRVPLVSGTVYPILHRLENAGWIAGEWAFKDPIKKVGRPKRRLYKLTDEGEKRAKEALDELAI